MYYTWNQNINFLIVLTEKGPEEVAREKSAPRLSLWGLNYLWTNARLF